MDIEDLRKIGQRLKEEILPLARQSHDSSPVRRGASGDMTYAFDKRAEDIVLEGMEKLKMPVTVISEECGVKELRGGGPRLLLDPVDGSKNALSGVPLFSTSISLVEGEALRETAVGYVVNLVTGDEWWALRGKGSFFNGAPIETQKDDVLRIIAYEARTPGVDIPRIIPLLSLFRRTRCLGSTALDMALLAQGAVSMFVTPSLSRTFDFASGYLLIREAGGVVTNMKGEEIGDIPAGIKKATPLLASANGFLHEKALQSLRAR